MQQRMKKDASKSSITSSNVPAMSGTNQQQLRLGTGLAMKNKTETSFGQLRKSSQGVPEPKMPQLAPNPSVPTAQPFQGGSLLS